MREPAGRHRAGAWAAIVLALATLLFTHPMAVHLQDGMADLWDAKLTAWILEWNFHQTFRDPLRLFDANIFHPARYALAFSENLFGAAVFGFPLYAAGVSTVAAYNTLFLLGMFLSAYGAWLLARELTGDAAASLVAAAVYAFGPWRISQIPHIQHQWGAFLPLVLLFSLRYLRSGAPRDRFWFAVFLVWNALCNIHYAFVSGALLLVVGIWGCLSGEPDARRRVRALLPAAAIAGVLVAVFFVPYVRASKLYGFERSTAEVEEYSGRPGDFLSAGSRNHLYAEVTRRFARPEGDFFPGLVPVALALVALRRGRSWAAPGSPGVNSRGPTARAHWKRAGSIALDILLLLFLAVWLAAMLRPGLRLGPLRLGDPQRLIVFATAALCLRLTIAFPRGARYENLGDFLSRGPLDPRMILFAALAAVGALVALGLHTPYYRFLFDSFGPVFRGIRAPARGIALFHLALGVLAAAGLSLLSRRRAGRSWRVLVVAATLILVGIEYRAWPIAIHPVDAEPPPVYRWLARAPGPSVVMEWPLGFPFDFEYEFRSTVHWKPIVNGASGFAPPLYLALWSELQKKPIPDSVWDRVREVGASVLVFHPHDGPVGLLAAARGAVSRGLEEGRLEALDSFPHGPDTDYVFRISTAPAIGGGSTPGRRREAAERFAKLTLRPSADPSPPLVFLDFPPEGVEVAAGAWAYGWVADDSGIADVRVATESGEQVPATFGGERPDVAKLLRGYADAQHPGFHFAIPKLSPGVHEFVVTVEGGDGGTTILRRPVRVR